MPSSSPFNDESLMTKLEIVLAGDGTVSKVTVVRPSRYLGFDSEAIDVVYNAGPYPDPPREIRSGNGKIYIHWSFHRDGRQCATSDVDWIPWSFSRNSLGFVARLIASSSVMSPDL